MPLSTKQMEYLALAWQCFESEPKIDYNKFYKVAGLASANSARELMRVTKNKLKSEYGALSGSVQTANGINGTPTKTAGAGVKKTTATPSNTPGSKRGRPKKAATEMDSDGEGEDEDDAEESPTKKAKKTGANGNGNSRSSVSASARKVKAETTGEDGLEDVYLSIFQ